MTAIRNYAPWWRLAFLPACLLAYIFGAFYEFEPATWDGERFAYGLLCALFLLAGGLLAEAGITVRRRMRSGSPCYVTAAHGHRLWLLAGGCWFTVLLAVAALTVLTGEQRAWLCALTGFVPSLAYVLLSAVPRRQPWSALCVLGVCGPVLVSHGHALQGGTIYTLPLLWVALAYGFLATAPALVYDALRTRTHRPAFAAAYLCLVGLALCCVVGAIWTRAICAWSGWSVVVILPAMNAAALLKGGDTTRHAPATALWLAAAVQLFVGLLILVAGAR